MQSLQGFTSVFTDQLIDPTGRGFEYLGGAELTVAANRIGPIFVDPRPILVITGRIVSMSAVDVAALRFNDDEAVKYHSRHDSAASGAATFTNSNNASDTFIRLAGTTATAARTFMCFTMNLPGFSHPLAYFNSQATGAAATVGPIQFGAGEYVSTDVIQTIDLRTAGGTATFGIDSGFAVFGTEL